VASERTKRLLRLRPPRSAPASFRSSMSSSSLLMGARAEPRRPMTARGRFQARFQHIGRSGTGHSFRCLTAVTQRFAGPCCPMLKIWGALNDATTSNGSRGGRKSALLRAQPLRPRAPREPELRAVETRRTGVADVGSIRLPYSPPHGWNLGRRGAPPLRAAPCNRLAGTVVTRPLRRSCGPRPAPAVPGFPSPPLLGGT
jgi:hypothetical protein